jgi:hypothetical protein
MKTIVAGSHPNLGGFKKERSPEAMQQLPTGLQEPWIGPLLR